MFLLKKKFRFEAGHQLKNHNGPCSEPHGHSYEFIVSLQSETLIATGPKKNMMMDFYDISCVVRPLIEEYLDHKWLNDTLLTDSPTVEFIAKWIFDKLEPHLNGLLCSVTVQETETSSAIYQKG